MVAPNDASVSTGGSCQIHLLYYRGGTMGCFSPAEFQNSLFSRFWKSFYKPAWSGQLRVRGHLG